MNDEELPVVSRLVIEIRSDGTRTIARGAAEDLSGQVRLEVRAESPAELVASLAKLLLEVPALAANTFRAGRKRQVELTAAAPPRPSLAARLRRRLGLPGE